jgi:multidrug efflux system outer membrane protein
MRKIFPVIVLLLALGSCVGPKYAEPDTKIDDQYSSYQYDTLGSNVDTILNIEWWKLFEDEQLNTLIKAVLNENRDILMAAQRVEQARAILGFTNADRYPNFSYSAGAARGNFAGQRVPLTSNFYGNASLSWELDFWGKYRAASESARASLAASDYGMRSIQMSMISTVAQTYFILLDFQKRLEVSQKTLGSRDSAVLIIQQRYDAGLVPEIDLNQAQINQAQALGSVPFYKRQVALIKNALATMVGTTVIKDNFTKDISETKLLVEIPYGLPSQLIKRRPDILASEEAYHAQFKQINVAVAQRFPSISITGLLGGASNELSSLTTAGLAWNAGAGLLGPIFNFGKNKRRVEVERAKAKEAFYNYENTVLNSFREVEDALVSIQTLKEELKAVQMQATAAMNAERLSKMRYDKGVTSYLEVLDNQRTSFSAQLNLSETKQELINSYIDLYKALGGGWISEEEKQQ